MSTTQDPAARQQLQSLYALGQPGEQHRRLAAMVGDWDVALTVLLDPTAPLRSEGMIARKTLVMSGRHVEEEIVAGTIGGIENRRKTWLGHNNVNGRWELTTIDDLDTHMQRYQGLSGDGNAPIVLFGDYTQGTSVALVAGDGISRATNGVRPTPRGALAGAYFTVRVLLTINPDDHAFEFFFRPATGQEAKAMEFRYTRRV